jgi:tetratricopeptide (TPR) repeat protein
VSSLLPALLSLLAVASGAGPSHASFADSLFAHGYLPEAGREYRKAVALDDTLPAAVEARYLHRIGLGLAARGQTDEAVSAFNSAAALDSGIASSSALAAAGVLASRRRWAQARMTVSAATPRSLGSADRARLLRATAWLALMQGDAAVAAPALGSLGMTDMAESTRLALEPAGRRSPATAMVMSSLVPGLGETHAGRPVTGLLSLAVNCASAAGVYWAVRSGDPVSAGLVFTALFLRFYDGSRRNAAHYATMRNHQLTEERLAAIARKCVAEPVWFGDDDSLVRKELDRAENAEALVEERSR